MTYDDITRRIGFDFIEEMKEYDKKHSIPKMMILVMHLGEYLQMKSFIL